MTGSTKPEVGVASINTNLQSMELILIIVDQVIQRFVDIGTKHIHAVVSTSVGVSLGHAELREYPPLFRGPGVALPGNVELHGPEAAGDGAVSLPLGGRGGGAGPLVEGKPEQGGKRFLCITCTKMSAVECNSLDWTTSWTGLQRKMQPKLLSGLLILC